MTLRQRKTEAAWWRRTAQRESKHVLGLCNRVSREGAYKPLTSMRHAYVQLFKPVEQSYRGKHVSAFFWPRSYADECTNHYAGAKKQDRILAACLIAAMIESGD